MKITKKTKLSEIIDNPKAKEALDEFDFPCITCPFARYEMESLDIGTICDMYNIDLDKVVKKLNEKLNKEK